MIGGFTPQSKANQFLGNSSQPIIAATDQLGVYIPPPYGVILSNFIHSHQ